MAKLVLHIGTKKTGTTSLQHYLKANSERLAETGWMYPDFIANPNHLVLALPFQQADSIAHVARSIHGPAGRDRSAASWAAKFRERLQPDQRWVITSEFFSTRLQTPHEVQDAVDYFRTLFDDITVVVFFRRQEFLLPSVYSQTAKDGDRTEWGWKFCEDRLSQFDYFAMYERWASAVGEQNVRAIPYMESFKHEPQRTLEQFSAASGIKFGADWVVPRESSSNKSLSGEGIAFLNVVNPYIPQVKTDNTSNHHQRRSVVRRAAELTEGPGFRPEAEIIDRLRQHYQASNEQLVAKLPKTGEWSSWLEQRPKLNKSGSNNLVVTPERVAELMVSLAAPNGPVDWGQPDSKPLRLRQLAEQRLASRRYGRVLLRVGRSSSQQSKGSQG
ncbi:MAG: hypothetical protein WCI74_03850 [Actinomycetes bacterium]